MCAIFGIAGADEASNLTYLGLHSLQHRGQEGAGIVSTDGQQHYVHKRQGHVSEVFTPAAINRLKGRAAIGHTRYSTTGGNTAENLQPIQMRSSLGWVAVVHNGNLVNAAQLIQSLERDGAIFQSTIDTEVIVHLMARSREPGLIEALTRAIGMRTFDDSAISLDACLRDVQEVGIGDQ